MQTSILFSHVMTVLWDGNDADVPTEARAIAAYMKNHQINRENACEVLAKMWPDATMTVRNLSDDERHSDDPSEVWFDVRFSDRSQVLLIAKRGIGDAVEVIS